MKRTLVPLTKKEILKLKKVLPLWSCTKKDTVLSRAFTTKTHIDALVLIARITVHAQVLNHHPTITFTYAKVVVTVTTHDTKSLTKRDVELATEIDAIKVGG